MRLPKDIQYNVAVRNWMAQGRSDETGVNSSSFSSPILKEADGPSRPHVVTLRLRPFRSTNLSVDSFMSSQNTRIGNSNQKFMLKPLAFEQRNSASALPVPFGKEEVALSASSSKECKRISEGKSTIRADKSHLNFNRENKVSPSVVTIGEYNNTSFLNKQYTVPDNLYTVRNNVFRSLPRISNYGVNYHTEYFNILQPQTSLVATGTPASMIGPKRTQTARLTPKWGTAKSLFVEKGCKYIDPMLGCGPRFQARITEITQHELDTVKWEKGKRGKKKSSSG